MKTAHRAGSVASAGPPPRLLESRNPNFSLKSSAEFRVYSRRETALIAALSGILGS